MLPQEDFSAIISETFHLESVTPVSIHGADGKTPELRLASIKGMMRYWYRMVQENPSGSLQKEGDIFGLAQNNDSKKSKVWLTSNVKKESLNSEEDYKPYGAFPTNVFNKGVAWEITLSASHKSREAYEQGKSSLLLAFLLGGFGVRSRHSMSSFGIRECEIKEDKDFIDLVEKLIHEVSDIKLSTDINSISRVGSAPLKGPYWKSTHAIKCKSLKLYDIKAVLEEARKTSNMDDILGGAGYDAERYPSPLFTSLYPLKNGKYLVIISEVYPEAFSSPIGSAKLYNEAKNVYIDQLRKNL